MNEQKKAKEMFISFVLPAYNEEESIPELLARITTSMKSINSDYELVFVIEGTDNSLAILEEFKKANPKIRIKIFYEKEPRGIMNAFKFGFNNIAAEATHVVTMDVDLNHYPEELPRLIEKAKQGYNIVIGSRAIEGAKRLKVPLLKTILSKFSNFVFDKMFDIKVKDKSSGYRMFDAATIKEIAPLVEAKSFEGLMEILLIAANKKKTFIEVPITMIFRKYGESKVKLIPVGKGYLRLLLRRKKIRAT
ncbi:MAG TPA: glycosyltransferase [Candidatus Nanoarchaeia archaeon]|nr:glycosyltransferase [Candidatus Nanoarchaeia archaeon]